AWDAFLEKGDFMRKSRKILLCFLSVCLVLTGCSFASADAESLLLAKCESVADFPAGELYCLSAGGGAVDPDSKLREISKQMLAQLYGNGSYPPELDLVEGAAFYFSYAQPCEFAVFRCARANDADAVAQMCLKRLESLRSYWNTNGERADLANATVKIHGSYVLLIVSETPEECYRAFRRAL
ncbi:MAG: DUF4358 domain-containing protein, partial [Clostridia bacterium]|nr:DUF4358 domain-containing protein [Clostridia bacterium]